MNPLMILQNLPRDLHHALNLTGAFANRAQFGIPVKLFPLDSL